MNAGRDGAPRDQATGYKMIRDVDIRSFRHFEAVRLSDFRTINLVVGDNGAGKTALLEALFLAAGSAPNIPARFRHWRGLPSQSGSLSEAYDAFFRPLFPNQDRDKTVEIHLSGTDEDNRVFSMYYAAARQPIPLQATDQAPDQSILSYRPVTLKWGAIALTPLIQPPSGLLFPVGPDRLHDVTYIAARQPFDSADNARWFSTLSKENKEGRFVHTIREEFPEIESITSEADGDVFILFAKLRGQPDKRPLNYISDGLLKMATLLLHITYAERAATFVDEIENGIHFSRHERLLRQLVTFCDTYASQLFATTHSAEFLNALLPVIKSNPDVFSLTRVARSSDGKGTAKLVAGESVLRLIESGLELRE